MSASENPFVAETSHREKIDIGSSLRWWPAAGLIALMGMLKVIPSLMESPPLPVLMMLLMSSTPPGVVPVVASAIDSGDAAACSRLAEIDTEGPAKVQAPEPVIMA